MKLKLKYRVVLALFLFSTFKGPGPSIASPVFNSRHTGIEEGTGFQNPNVAYHSSFGSLHHPGASKIDIPGYTCWSHGRGISSPTVTVDRFQTYSSLHCPVTRNAFTITRHTADCSKYTVCTSNSPFPTHCECDPGNKFSVERGTCHPSHDVTDCPLILSTKIDDSRNCESSGQLISHGEDCTKYFQCVSLVSGESLLIEYQCPAAQGFDQLTSQCRTNFCQLVDGINPRASQATFPALPAYFTKYFNITPVTHQSIVTASSSRYYTSNSFPSTLKSKPLSHYFEIQNTDRNPEQFTNFRPAQVEQKNHGNIGSAAVPCLRPLEEMNDECAYQGFFPLDGNCKNYMVCLPGRNSGYEAYVIQCPDDKDFSKTYRRCVPAYLSDCRRPNSGSGAGIRSVEATEYKPIPADVVEKYFAPFDIDLVELKKLILDKLYEKSLQLTQENTENSGISFRPYLQNKTNETMNSDSENLIYKNIIRTFSVPVLYDEHVEESNTLEEEYGYKKLSNYEIVNRNSSYSVDDQSTGYNFNKSEAYEVPPYFPSGTTQATTELSTRTTTQSPTSTSTELPTSPSTELPTSSSTEFPSSSSTTELPTSSSTTELPTSSSTTELPTSSSTTELPTSSSTTELPTSSSTTEIPTSSSTELPTSSSTTELPTSSSTTELPTSSSTTELPTSSSTTELPTSSSTTELPTSSSTEIPSSSSTAEIPTSLSTTELPTSSSTTELPSSSSTTELPTSSSTTELPSSSSTTELPTSSSTTELSSSSLTPGIPNSSSTEISTSSSTELPTSSSTEIPTSSSTELPTSSSSTEIPTSSSSELLTSSSTTELPTSTSSSTELPSSSSTELSTSSSTTGFSTSSTTQLPTSSSTEINTSSSTGFSTSSTTQLPTSSSTEINTSSSTEFPTSSSTTEIPVGEYTQIDKSYESSIDTESIVDNDYEVAQSPNSTFESVNQSITSPTTTQQAGISAISHPSGTDTLPDHEPYLSEVYEDTNYEISESDTIPNIESEIYEESELDLTSVSSEQPSSSSTSTAQTNSGSTTTIQPSNSSTSTTEQPSSSTSTESPNTPADEIAEIIQNYEPSYSETEVYENISNYEISDTLPDTESEIYEQFKFDSPSESSEQPSSASTSTVLSSSISASTAPPSSTSTSTVQPSSSTSTVQPSSSSTSAVQPISSATSTVQPSPASTTTVRPSSSTSTVQPNSPSTSTESPTIASTPGYGISEIIQDYEPSYSESEVSDEDISNYEISDSADSESEIYEQFKFDLPSVSSEQPSSASTSTFLPSSISTSTAPPSSPSTSSVQPISSSTSTVQPSPASTTTVRPSSSTSTVQPISPSTSTESPTIASTPGYGISEIIQDYEPSYSESEVSDEDISNYEISDSADSESEIYEQFKFDLPSVSSKQPSSASTSTVLPSSISTSTAPPFSTSTSTVQPSSSTSTVQPISSSSSTVQPSTTSTTTAQPNSSTSTVQPSNPFTSTESPTIPGYGIAEIIQDYEPSYSESKIFDEESNYESSDSDRPPDSESEIYEKFKFDLPFVSSEAPSSTSTSTEQPSGSSTSTVQPTSSTSTEQSSIFTSTEQPGSSTSTEQPSSSSTSSVQPSSSSTSTEQPSSSSTSTEQPSSSSTSTELPSISSTSTVQPSSTSTSTIQPTNTELSSTTLAIAEQSTATESTLIDSDLGIYEADKTEAHEIEDALPIEDSVVDVPGNESLIPISKLEEYEDVLPTGITDGLVSLKPETGYPASVNDFDIAKADGSKFEEVPVKNLETEQLSGTVEPIQFEIDETQAETKAEPVIQIGDTLPITESSDNVPGLEIIDTPPNSESLIPVSKLESEDVLQTGITDGLISTKPEVEYPVSVNDFDIANAEESKFEEVPIENLETEQLSETLQPVQFEIDETQGDINSEVDFQSGDALPIEEPILSESESLAPVFESEDVHPVAITDVFVSSKPETAIPVSVQDLGFASTEGTTLEEVPLDNLETKHFSETLNPVVEENPILLNDQNVYGALVSDEVSGEYSSEEALDGQPSDQAGIPTWAEQRDASSQRFTPGTGGVDPNPQFYSAPGPQGLRRLYRRDQGFMPSRSNMVPLEPIVPIQSRLGHLPRGQPMGPVFYAGPGPILPARLG